METLHPDLIRIGGSALILLVLLQIIRVVTISKLKNRLLDMGTPIETTRTMLELPRNDRRSTLKWGIVNLSVGIAFVIIEFLPYDWSNAITYGLILLGVGVGLLIYYRVAPPDHD